MGTPAFYTVGEQRVSLAILKAWRTGDPIVGISKLDKTRLVNVGIAYVDKNSKLILNRDAFLARVYVVPESIWEKLTDPVYRQMDSAKKRGFSSLEAYQNRKSIRMSDEKKYRLKAPYKGKNKEIIKKQPPDIAEPILFPEPLIPVNERRNE